MGRQSVVMMFPAMDLAAGPMTKENPGLAIRLQVHDEILHDGLDLQVEVLNAPKQVVDDYVALSTTLFDAKFRVTQNRPNAWRANAIYHNVEALMGHPVFGMLIRLRKQADQAIVVYEGGLAILRIDVADDVASAVAERMQQAMNDNHLEGTVRITPADRSLEDWQPLQ